MTSSRPPGFVPPAEALRKRVDTRIVARGSITVPAVPAMVEDFTGKCVRIFGELGRPFSPEEVAHLRDVMARQLADAFARSSRSTVTVSFESRVAAAMTYETTVNCLTIEEAYHEWVVTRDGPLFGVEPDARVWALAAESADPAGDPVLDIGAGTGRNALALARRGHPVDAVELTARFAETIRQEAAAGDLGVRVIQRDVFARDAYVRSDYALVLLSEVVSDFRSPDDLRRVFELAAGCLRPGGQLVFNVFLTEPGYLPDDAARQFAQQAYSSLFTPGELAQAVSGLPLELIADDSVLDYEEEHLPAGSWPPTSWYEGWVGGRDVFGLERGECPLHMHWLVYRRS